MQKKHYRFDLGCFYTQLSEINFYKLASFRENVESLVDFLLTFIGACCRADTTCLPVPKRIEGVTRTRNAKSACFEMCFGQLVSAFAAENDITLGQLKTAELHQLIFFAIDRVLHCKFLKLLIKILRILLIKKLITS